MSDSLRHHDYSLPGSSVHGIFQAIVLEWIAISFSRLSSWPRVWAHISWNGRWVLYHWATREALPDTYPQDKVIFLSHVQFFVIPLTTAHQVPLSFTTSSSLLKFMFVELVMLSNHLICCPLLCLPSVFPSIRVFSSELALWSHSFSISPSNEYSGLISFRIDWFDLLAFQGTLKSLLQHHILKASVLQCSAFFIVQLSHPYMTTGETIGLTIQTFVGKLLCLCFLIHCLGLS